MLDDTTFQELVAYRKAAHEHRGATDALSAARLIFDDCQRRYDHTDRTLRVATDRFLSMMAKEPNT